MIACCAARSCWSGTASACTCSKGRWRRRRRCTAGPWSTTPSTSRPGSAWPSCDNEQGEKAEAAAILDHVDGLSAGINRWRWDKALLTYQLGRTDILARDLAWIVANIPGQRQDALKMAFSLWPEPAVLRDHIGRDNIIHLFHHAARTGKVEAALAFWPEVEKLGVDNYRPEVLVFLNSLIQHDRLAEAAAIWRTYFNGESLLANGDFDKEPTNTAFDWRISAPKGSSWRIEAADDGKGRAMAPARSPAPTTSAISI